MGGAGLGKHAREAFPTRLYLAAADDAESPRLRRSPPALSHHSDSVHVVSRFADGGEGGRGCFRQPGRPFLLLAGGALRNSLPADLVSGAARLLAALSLSDEHDKGSALRDHLFGACHLSAVCKKVLAAPAVGLPVCTVLRNACAAHFHCGD